MYVYLSGPTHWPSGLRPGSAAARMLGLRVRTPQKFGCLFLLSVVCCELEVSATSWLLLQRGPTDCGMSLRDPENLRMRRLWPTLVCCPRSRKNNIYQTQALAGWQVLLSFVKPLFILKSSFPGLLFSYSSQYCFSTPPPSIEESVSLSTVCMSHNLS
jgi:hypothetical protein